MTIVEYFDPRNGEHLKAWRKMERESHPGRMATDLAAFLGDPTLEPIWPDGWGPSIIAKMANAWLEDNIPPDYVPMRENIRRIKEAHIQNLLWELREQRKRVATINPFSETALKTQGSIDTLERLLVHWGMQP